MANMASAIQMNMKFVVGLFAILSVTIYCMYHFWSEKLHLSGTNRGAVNLKDIWREGQVEEIPESVLSSVEQVKINEGFVEVGEDQIKVFRRESTPNNFHPSKLQVLLLHGAAFSSADWLNIHTIQIIAAMGLRVVAVDLPGFGKSESADKPKDRAEFLTALIKEEKMGKPVIVSPSMSGQFSFPYIFRFGGKGCTDQISGFIPVAPAAVQEYTTSFSECQVPALIVYGTKDDSGELVSKMLSKLPNSQVTPLPDAPHAAYLTLPDEWHKLVYKFLTLLNR